MTIQHAVGLAKFVSLYKLLLIIQRRINGGKHRSTDTFIAGLLGGYAVFGDRTPINEQVRFFDRFIYRIRLKSSLADIFASSLTPQ